MYTLIKARHKESGLGEKMKQHKQTNLTAVSATAIFPNGDLVPIWGLQVNFMVAF